MRQESRKILLSFFAKSESLKPLFLHSRTISTATKSLYYDISSLSILNLPSPPCLSQRFRLIPHLTTRRFLTSLLLDLPIDLDQLSVLIVVTLESVSSNFRVRPRSLIDFGQSSQNISVSHLRPRSSQRDSRTKELKQREE